MPFSRARLTEPDGAVVPSPAFVEIIPTHPCGLLPSDVGCDIVVGGFFLLNSLADFLQVETHG
jgi:hypothetical protein